MPEKDEQRNCIHSDIECINPYEIIRKYRCHNCGEVMMCACEKEFAEKYLPHQISVGQDLKTKERVPVTLGFQPSICNTCRELPELPCPKKPMHGATSKISRYYWREIQKNTIRRFAEWAEQNSHEDWLRTSLKNQDQYNACRRQVIEEIKELHRKAPKYQYNDKSQSDIIEEYGVPVVMLKALYSTSDVGELRIQRGSQWLSPECYVAEEYRSKGYSVVFSESRPFHALFGILMWRLIQDSADPQVRPVMFGERLAFEEKREGAQITALHPADFGSSGYAIRRETKIREHLESLPRLREELLDEFDKSIEPSTSLRQYLWAHKSENVSTARRIIKILPPDVIIRILEYLVGDYWSRYCGWPDLIVYNDDEFCFVEIKSSKDKLSEKQKSWIKGNSNYLDLPFKLVKIHKKK